MKRELNSRPEGRDATRAVTVVRARALYASCHELCGGMVTVRAGAAP